MEELIPVLMAIAYFVFQAYTGYKKEKKKAAKRQYGKSVSQEPQRSEPTVTYEPEYKTEYEPTYEPYVEPAYVEPAYVPDMPPSLLEEYKKQSEYTEMERVKAEKKKVLQSRQINHGRTVRPRLEQLETEEIDDIDPQEFEVDFDVKQAILSKAILDRPYA